jgi:hypothetical protein
MARGALRRVVLFPDGRRRGAAAIRVMAARIGLCWTSASARTLAALAAIGADAAVGLFAVEHDGAALAALAALARSGSLIVLAGLAVCVSNAPRSGLLSRVRKAPPAYRRSPSKMRRDQNESVPPFPPSPTWPLLWLPPLPPPASVCTSPWALPAFLIVPPWPPCDGNHNPGV